MRILMVVVIDGRYWYIIWICCRGDVVKHQGKLNFINVILGEKMKGNIPILRPSAASSYLYRIWNVLERFRERWGVVIVIRDGEMFYQKVQKWTPCRVIVLLKLLFLDSCNYQKSINILVGRCWR